MDVLRKAKQDILDCIGCNDCMIACPIPEKAFVSIAQLNEAVSQSEIQNNAVRKFVQACTQCQQCVPVCPAHLHRANMVLFNKMKIEKNKADGLVPSVMKHPEYGEVSCETGWTRYSLVAWLSTQASTKMLQREVLHTLVQYASIVSLDFEEILHTTGDYHENLYILLDGQVSEILQSQDHTMKLLTIETGAIFGTSQVLHDAPCHYTIQSVERSELLRIHKSIIHRLRQSHPDCKKWLDDLYRQNTFARHFQEKSQLVELFDSDKRLLLDAGLVKEFSDKQQIATRGAQVDGLWLIQGGFIQIKQDHIVLDYAGPGDELGVLSFLRGQVYTHNWFAVGKVFALLIPRKKFREIMDGYPRLKQRFLADFVEPDITGQAISPEPVRNTTVLGFSYQNIGKSGLLGAKRVLVIDQQICTDCNACVDACGDRHGVSRLQRRGLQMEQYLFPSACRHCEDPKCLMCTVRGIQRKPTGEIFIDPNGSCVGCGACAERCPYDNITMIKREQLLHKPTWLQKTQKMLFSSNRVGGDSFWETGNLLDLIFQRKPPKSDHVQHGPDCVAVKCDLCAEYPEEACVKACPVGAAFRVSGEDVIQASRDTIQGEE